MQNFGKWIGVGAIVVAGLTSVAGCNKEGEADSTVANQVVQNSTTAAANVANSAVATTSNVANDVSAATSNVVNDVSAATSNAVNTMGGAMKTGEIKAKIIANPSLNNPKNDINVDSDATTVTIKGHVQNATQKTLAESIAKQNAGGRKVVNSLTISGGKM